MTDARSGEALADDDRVRLWLNDCDSVFRMSDRDWDRMREQLAAVREEERVACWQRLLQLFDADPLAWSLVRRGLLSRAVRGGPIAPSEREPSDSGSGGQP